jgi:hypothetical protein
MPFLMLPSWKISVKFLTPNKEDSNRGYFKGYRNFSCLNKGVQANHCMVRTDGVVPNGSAGASSKSGTPPFVDDDPKRSGISNWD